MAVVTGLERVFEEDAFRGRLEGRQIAWLVNASSVDAKLNHALDRSLAAGLRPACVFGPEHGLRGAAQDMIGVGDARDPITGLRCVSLYGHSAESLRPQPGSLDGLDVILIDLQDIGTRFYTYAYTAALMVEAAASAGIEAWILDRPNPLGGQVVEGNVVIDAYTSFVGMYPGIATRHGMTLGELISMLAGRYGWKDALEVVPMLGYERGMCFEETGLPWVMPSPNMPTLETARVYPGQCLLEGTNMSEGRGTTRPFEIFGAPWLDVTTVEASLEQSHLAGASLRPLAFQPTFQKHAGELCHGFQMHVHEERVFRSVAASYELLRVVWDIHRPDFEWREEAYEFVSDRLAIDLLIGDPLIRHALEDGMPTSDLLDTLAIARAGFEEERRAHLLYDDGAR